MRRPGPEPWPGYVTGRSFRGSRPRRARWGCSPRGYGSAGSSRPAHFSDRGDLARRDGRPQAPGSTGRTRRTAGRDRVEAGSSGRPGRRSAARQAPGCSYWRASVAAQAASSVGSSSSQAKSGTGGTDSVEVFATASSRCGGRSHRGWDQYGVVDQKLAGRLPVGRVCGAAGIGAPRRAAQDRQRADHRDRRGSGAAGGGSGRVAIGDDSLGRSGRSQSGGCWSPDPSPPLA